MKTKIKNCLTTTAVALVLLALVANLYHARFLCIETVYQVLVANIAIHLSLHWLKRFESQYFLIEILVEMGTMLSILILAGFLFDWYNSTPLGVLLLMGISVYFIGSLIDIFHIKKDLNFINTQLEKREKHLEI